MSDTDKRWVRVILEGEQTLQRNAGFFVGGQNWINPRLPHVKSIEEIDPPEDLRDGDLYLDGFGNALRWYAFANRVGGGFFSGIGREEEIQRDLPNRPLTLLVRDGKPVQR